MLGKQFMNKQLPVFSPILMNRFFSKEHESTESGEEVKEKDVAEEVMAPVFHNQFSHVFAFYISCLLCRKNQFYLNIQKKMNPQM